VLCAVGAPLTPEELAEEARRAALPPADPSCAEPSSPRAAAAEADGGRGEELLRGGGGPLGFDALLAQGVPRAEVERMRADLLAAADPSSRSAAVAAAAGPAAVRAREERWLASSGREAALLAGGGEDWDWDEGDGGGHDAAAGRALDDGAVGALAGFLWPPAAWVGARGEGGGAWSRRRQAAAVAGLLANVLFAVFRAMSARWEGA
jgi:hypothetical protein